MESCCSKRTCKKLSSMHTDTLVPFVFWKEGAPWILMGMLWVKMPQVVGKDVDVVDKGDNGS